MWYFLYSVAILYCMNEIIIDTIEWSAPEYSHKERNPDWFWTIGLVTIIGASITIWFHNYIFAIFILISGACLIIFTLRTPHNIAISIKTEGIKLGKEEYLWENIKGFNIKNKNDDSYGKLLLLTSKKFLPIYTIPFPNELSLRIKESISKIVPNIKIEESPSMLFMEKLGF